MCSRREESLNGFSGHEGRAEAEIWEAKSAHRITRLRCSGTKALTVSHSVLSLLSGSGPTGASPRLLGAARRRVGFIMFPPLMLMGELGPWRVSWPSKYSNASKTG